MREILFRGKGDTRYNEGCWCYGMPICCSDGDWQICWQICGCNTKRVVLPETIGEYTGLNDENGVMVFEGDICEVTLFDPFGHDTQYVCKVVYGCGGFHFSFVDSDGDEAVIPFFEVEDFETYVTVIGNVYETPELMKGK